MSILKKILTSKLNENEQLTAATPQNKASSSFSLLKNIHGSDITSNDVSNHLHSIDNADDTVDTVAFGLETTDGEIVKVYVNADEADSFEQRMSQLLGKIDNIDQAIEELSNEFDIVSVVKPGENDANDVSQDNLDGDEHRVGIENKLDEPLTDADIAQDMDDEDLIDDDSKKDDEKEDKDDEKDEEDKDEEDKDEEDKDEDDLSFDDSSKEDDKDEEDKDEDEEDKDEDEDEEDEKDSKKKEKKKTKDKEDKMKQEGQSILKYLVSLTESKKEHHKKADHKKESKPSNLDKQNDSEVDVFHVSLNSDEDELSKIFSTPIQQLIFRTVLLLGVNAEQINIRKFKVRNGIKDVATMIQHHPQIKNILTKLGKELAMKKNEIHKITEDEELQGTIKDQLSTEITKKIYGLILALGVPEFLLTYKKTALRNRIKNLAKIAVKHSRIKTYIYMLIDLLKAEHKSSLKENYENIIDKNIEIEKSKVFKSGGLLEDFSKTDEAADLGTFTVVSMGSVGGTTIKVKDFSVDFSEEEFEKLVSLLNDGESGIVKSENYGKVNLISLAHGKQFVIKSVKPNKNEKYPFGVLISSKSIDKILE